MRKRYDTSAESGNAMSNGQKVYSVTEITRSVKLLIKENFPPLWVEGEISNFRVSPTGHAYFMLKDENAQLSAVIFKSSRIKMTDLKDGESVRVFGILEVYEKRGTYQIIVNIVEKKGIGALALAFEALKKRLSKEGLFDKKYKKEIPAFPRRIGIVTSPTGAAVRDILNVLQRRFANTHVILNPVRVQGDEAAAEIAEAIDEFNMRGDVDVMIIGRGGGSIEDLWPFNTEIVARAIFRSEIPIISAVGHEIDFTISDFVADIRAPTPSAAAEIVIEKKSLVMEKIGSFGERILHAAAMLLQSLKTRLKLAAGSYVFMEPANLVRQRSQEIDELINRMHTSASHGIAMLSHRIDALIRRLEALDPTRVLARGYSITTDAETGKLIWDAEKAPLDTAIITRLMKGQLISTVKKRLSDE